MRYVYPAILVPLNEEHFKGYGVEFPDLENAFTEGLDLYDALYMAEDLLSGFLVDMEDSGEELPAPSDIKNVKTDGDSFVTLIKTDTDIYRQMLEELKKERAENPESDENDDSYISDWLSERIFKIAGIEKPDE